MPLPFEMLLPYDIDDEDFVRGFECGRIWVLMEENPYKLTGLIFHAVNAEMVLGMIEKKGIDLTVEFTDDEQWMRFSDG